jgi:putative oxidoreductase
MSFKNFLFPTYYDESRAYSVLLLIVRIFFGMLFLTHGYDKLMQHAALANLFADPLGIGSFISFWMVIFSEVVCSFALIFGILQRIVLIPMITTMCVAFFIVHGGDAFAVKELSFVYLIVFIILYITGPGKYSFDAIIGDHIVDNTNREFIV